MPRFEGPDLSSLASLAQSQDLDLRPVLLRVHTDLFVGAPSRDRATIEAFEALALGFLPIVDDATAAIVAHKLAPIADTPARILDALVQRGGEARAAVLEIGSTSASPDEAVPRRGQAVPAIPPHKNLEGGKLDELLALRDADVDLALARNRYARLSSPQLQQLVERARERPLLALALLDRRDLGPADEAVLYLHADDSRRRQIRSRLEKGVALTGRGVQLPRADRRAVEVLLAHARALDLGPFEAQLTLMLRLTRPPAWRFQTEPRRELLALGLVAAGVGPEDCIRIFLTLHPSISRSVRTVFHLAEVARTVPRPVAIHLIEAVLGATVEVKREGRYVPAADPSGTPVRDRAARPTLAQIRAAVQARRAG
jgi:hypothetical protein